MITGNKTIGSQLFVGNDSKAFILNLRKQNKNIWGFIDREKQFQE
jgi:hypothetical protein